MAKKDKFIRSRTLYTLRKRHAVVSGGTVYENDYTTILPDDGIYDDDMALFSNSNFKYRIRSNTNEKKRHVRGEFVEGTSGDTWTLEGLSGGTTASDESKIVLKPDYTSLKDFAYFGSATQLIRATVNDIILRFPGGLSYYGDDAPQVYYNGKSYDLVSNEFDIDCWTMGGNISSGEVSNPMRILAASYMNYEDAKGNPISAPIFCAWTESYCPNTIIGDTVIAGETFYVYMDGEGGKHLITDSAKTGTIIRPKQSFIDEFWASMDDFEKILLDRETTPVYTAKFETPYEDETGHHYRMKKYTWPTVGNDGFTPDMTTGRFQGYLQSLLALAEYHDTYDSDNIYRMLTHESIKNLDWTFVSEQDGETVEMDDIDDSKFSAMLRIHGRMFDDLKRYTDNIKTANAVSYDEKNNMPDYFLTDTVEIDGWQAQNVAPFVNEYTDAISASTVRDGESVDVLFEKSGKTSSYVNSCFMRRLALNSDYIQSMKGTRRGIETILRMFGYTPATESSTGAGTFNMKEYVAVVSSGLSYSEASRLRALGEYVNYDENTNYMVGYPVAVIVPAGLSGSEANDESKWYLMPWYDRDTSYRNSMYFQEYGGWGKRASKSINLPSLTTATTIAPGNTVDIYGETLPYMRYAASIEDMLSMENTGLKVNTVCYVTDITDMCTEGYYSKDPKDKTNASALDYSHYFVLKNLALAGYVGYVSNDIYNCYGWRNVYKHEMMSANTAADFTEDGLRVLYLESLTAQEEGNNPHVGYGEYDDGDHYLERFRNLFSNPFTEGVYDYLNNPDDAESLADYTTLANGYGFSCTTVEDNYKCAYFQDSVEISNSELMAIGDLDEDLEWNTSALTASYRKAMNDENAEIFNPEPSTPAEGEDTQGTGALDEAQANCIINLKKLTLNINTKDEDTGEPNKHLRKYIQDVVFKYVEPMIPSTTILEYTFDNEKPNPNAIITPDAFGRFTSIVAGHAAMNNSNENTTIWMEYPTPIRNI